MRDLYDVLGVSNNASNDEIKKSYRKILRYDFFISSLEALLLTPKTSYKSLMFFLQQPWHGE